MARFVKYDGKLLEHRGEYLYVDDRLAGHIGLEDHSDSTLIAKYLAGINIDEEEIGEGK